MNTNDEVKPIDDEQDLVDNQPISEEELKKLIALIEQAYQEVGRKVTTMTYLDGVNDKVVLDNRDDTDLN